jgi:cullin 1
MLTKVPFTTGANLMGGEIYSNIREYLKKHLAELLSKSKDSGVSLLHYYTKQWERYTRSSTTIHHIGRYLNRNWVKREIDEGRKNVYDLNTVMNCDDLFVGHSCCCKLTHIIF